MALALRFEQLLSSGEIANYRELAELGHVSPARVTQVMNLLGLAPNLQEQILGLPRVEKGRDPLHLRQLQPIAATLNWQMQRKLWHKLQASVCGGEVSDSRGPLIDG
jgi:hypothetical protein